MGPLPKSKSGNQHVYITIECYSNLTRAIPSKKCLSTHPATILLDSGILLHDISNYVLTHNDLHFVSKCFTTLRLFLGLRNWRPCVPSPFKRSTPALYPYIIRKNSSLCLWASKRLGTYVEPLAYASNTQTHRAIERSAFYVLLLCELPSVATFDRLAGPANDMKGEVTQRSMPHRHLQRIKLMKATASSPLSTGQWFYKWESNENVPRKVTLKIGATYQ